MTKDVEESLNSKDKKNVDRLLCLATVSSSLAWQSLAILCGECMALRAHFSTARNSDIHATIVLQWLFTIGARGNAVSNSPQAPLNPAVNVVLKGH